MNKSTTGGTFVKQFGVYFIWNINDMYYIFDWSGSQCGNEYTSVGLAIAWLRIRGVTDPK